MNRCRARTTFAFLFLLHLALPALSGEFYDERPDVLKVKPVDHESQDELSVNWLRSRDGHLAFLAQALTFFPKDDYYFLARDIEYAYDIARVIFKNNPEMLKRIHLVPVSTALSEETSKMVKYLEQEGLTKSRFKKRLAVFLDSCCSGSIPDRISKAFEESGIKTFGFLIQSNAYPKSSVAAALGADGLEIEKLPHYTLTGREFIKERKKLRVAAPVDYNDKQASKKIMEQIRHDFDSREARARFSEMVSLMQTVHAYLFPSSKGKSVKSPGALKETHAIDALKVLMQKYGVSAEEFLEDMDTLKKKHFAKPDAERMKSLRKKTERFKALTDDYWVERLVKSSSDFDWLSVRFSDEGPLNRAIKRVFDSSPEGLGMKRAKHEKLKKNFLFKIKQHMPELESEVLELILKFVRQKAGERGAIDFLLLGAKEKTFERGRELLVAALKDRFAKEKYSLSDGGTMQHLLEDRWWELSMRPDLLEAILEDWWAHASPENIQRVVESLFTVFKDRYDLVSSGGALLEQTKKGIDALPTINKALVEAYLKSGFLKQTGPEYQKMNQWFFSQADYFDQNTLPLKVEPTYVGYLPALAGSENQNHTTTVKGMIKRAKANSDSKTKTSKTKCHVSLSRLRK